MDERIPDVIPSTCEDCGHFMPTGGIDGRQGNCGFYDEPTHASSACKAAPAAGAEQELVGIGGWLIFPAIGLIVGGVLSLVGLFTSLSLFSDVADAGYGGLYALNIVVAVGLFLLLIYAATRFFGKKADAPRAMITLIAANLGSAILLLIIEAAAGADVFVEESIKAVVQSVIAAAIWIPYFRVSKRVKATFVK